MSLKANTSTPIMVYFVDRKDKNNVQIIFTESGNRKYYDKGKLESWHIVVNPEIVGDIKAGSLIRFEEINLGGYEFLHSVKDPVTGDWAEFYNPYTHKKERIPGIRMYGGKMTVIA